MAKGPTITTIASGYYSRTALNDNFTNIDTAFDNTLSLDGSTPNALGADLDLNTNDIINVGSIAATSITVGGSLLSPSSVVVDAENVNLTPTGAILSTDVQAAFGVIGTTLYKTVADLLASTEPSHGVGSIWEAGGFRYVEVASGGDVVNAAATPVQLDVLACDDGSFNVAAFGAVSDGTTDASPAFQKAALAVTSYDYQLHHSAVLKAPVKTIVVSGSYNLVSSITSTDMIVWSLSAATSIDETKLSGTVNKGGRHINSTHTGILENATTLSLRAGRTLDAVGGVYGISTEDVISRVGPPHSVTLQIDNSTDVTPITLTGTTYTATNVVYTSVASLADVKIGATITTQGSPTHTGIITATDAAAKTITVGGGWRPYTGVDGSTGTPTNGDVAIIDYFEKIWGQNTNTFLRSGHATKKAAGYELGSLNYQSDSPVLNLAVDQEPKLWGFDSVNLGPYKGSAGVLARAGVAPWRTGFVSYGNEIGFQVAEKGALLNTIAYDAVISAGSAFRVTYGGSASFNVLATGNMEVGRTDAAQTTFIDLHSSGTTSDYDVRIQSTGGSATSGTGSLFVKAVLASFDCEVRPNVDKGSGLGSSTKRFSAIYADVVRTGAGGAIWTSGTGTPEGAVTASVGSMYTRTDGGAGTTLYIKESGAGTTGWVAK